MTLTIQLIFILGFIFSGGCLLDDGRNFSKEDKKYFALVSAACVVGLTLITALDIMY